MSNAAAKVQVNIKSGEGFDATLVNIYAENPDELAQLLTAVTQFAPQIAEARGAVALAHGIEVKKGSVEVQEKPVYQEQTGGWANNQPPGQQGPQEPQTSWGQPQQTPPPQFAQPATAGPTCQHGPMVHRSGNKNGRDWSGWFCPTPKGTPNQCSPQFGK